MDPVTLAHESLPTLVVILVGLMQVRYWRAVLTYEALVRELRQEIAFADVESRMETP